MPTGEIGEAVLKDPDKAIVCGACNVPVTTPSDPDPRDQIICAKCGARDTFEQVWKVCMEEVKDRFGRAKERGLANLDRQLGNPPRRAPLSDGEKPFFKWQFRA
jgi:hypothetical protein